MKFCPFVNDIRQLESSEITHLYYIYCFLLHTSVVVVMNQAAMSSCLLEISSPVYSKVVDLSSCLERETSTLNEVSEREREREREREIILH